MVRVVRQVSRLSVPRAVFSQLRAHSGPVAELSRLKSGTPKQIVARVSSEVAQQLSGQWATLTHEDILQIVGSLARLAHVHPPLLELVVKHVLRGTRSYPPYALCNVVNAFARLKYDHEVLMSTVASHFADSERAALLAPIDVSCLVFAYAELRKRRGDLLETLAERLSSLDVSGPDCAIILNSYSRLDECNPNLFKALSRCVIRTQSENFDQLHQISLIMNAFAKCKVRKPQMMQILGRHLYSRVDELTPQNVTNIVNAFARLNCYDRKLFVLLQTKLVKEPLRGYKVLELANLVHGLAKLGSGGPKLYAALFAECESRLDWDPRSVAQVLDTLRRRGLRHETLLLVLVNTLLRDLDTYEVHPLTQVLWCFVELDALELASRTTLPASEDESAARCLMRLGLERMATLQTRQPLSPTQQCYVQQMVRAYHYRYEMDYNLQPHHVKEFCSTLFDLPTSVTSSIVRSSRP